MMYFVVVMGGIILFVSAIALLDWYGRKKARKSSPGAA